MGTSFVERGQLSSPSIDSTIVHYKNVRHRRSSNPEKMQSSPSIDPTIDRYKNVRHRRSSNPEKMQRKNSRVTRRRRHSEKVDEICNASVKDSIAKFLIDSKHEDLQFSKANIDEGSLDDEEVKKLFRIDNLSEHRERRSSQKSRSNSGKKSNRSESRHRGSSRRKKNKKSKKSKSGERKRDEQHKTSSRNPTVGSGIANQATLHSSLSDLKSRFQSDNLTGSLRSHSLTSGRLKSRVRDRSGLVVGLESLDRQVRRDRMKKEYRCRSGDHRLGDSFSSGMSFRSQHTAQSYRRSGLEGGALNAYMGNDSFARHASRGGDITSLSESASSFFSVPASEDYLRERKARQDHIIDLARREKWLQAIKNEETEKQRKKDEIELILHFSDDEPEKKKDGLVDKLKRAANKTAKISKSSAKEAANAVVKSKLASKKSYTAVDQDEEKAEFFFEDSCLVTNQYMGGNKGSIIAVDAKGGFERRRSLTKNRPKVAGKEKRAEDSRVIPNSPIPRIEKKKKKHGSRSVSNSPKTGHRRKKCGSRSVSNSPGSGHGKKKQSSRSISNSPRIRDNKSPRSRLNFDKIRERFAENQSPPVSNVLHRTSGNISFNRSPFSNSPSEIPFPILTEDSFRSKFDDCDWWDI